MSANPNIAIVANVISEPSRATIITALLDGKFHPASELAFMAGIKPQTASFHLKKMEDAELIKVEKHGRHRYYGLKDQSVASTLESFLSVAPQAEVRTLKRSPQDYALRRARTCYDHLAGNLGVQLTSYLVNKNFLVEEQDHYIVTEGGEKFFASLQINISELKKKRRKLAHKCLDWSERRHHVAGALGHAIFERLLELQWIKRMSKTRAIKVTPLGKEELTKLFLFKFEN